LEKLKDKFERTKIIKRDKSEEIKKLEAQNKQYEFDNIQFEQTAHKTTVHNEKLNFENNELDSKIKKMKSDIDKALQAHEPAKMRKVIIDMCIQYLWNDYIFEENLESHAKLKHIYGNKSDILTHGILDIEHSIKR